MERIRAMSIMTGSVAAVMVVLLAMPSPAGGDSPHYLNTFAIQVDGGLDEAQAIASDLGFIVQRELPNIGVFLLEHPKVNHRSRRSADHHVSRLRSHPTVRYVQQEVKLNRVKRGIVHDKQLELPIREIKDNSVFHRIKASPVSSREFSDVVVFNDPCYQDMWYLDNRGQSGGERQLDMNIQVAWASGFSGEGVVVCILDDGIDHTHPDLTMNYDPKASADLNDKSDMMQDPMPNLTVAGNSHGTRCAGEVAAGANNRICGVGVAYNAKIGGIRILDGTVTDSLEAEALAFNNDYVDIYSASWGPNDDGYTMEAPNHFAAQALRNGVLKGRKGLGSIFVWATGNGGMNQDNCNADGYTSSVETLSVGSITDWGRQPFYMENCTSTLAVVPTGGEEYRGQENDLGQIKLKVITTDTGGGCIENFQGTSSAAPLGAGCLANVLQANPSLTWRDVQHIVVQGTRIPSVDSSWTINGGGHHVSHKFGFGLMDCGKMVHLAQDWNNVPEQHVCQYHRTDPLKIEFGGSITDKIYVDACKGHKSKWIQRLEHVQVRLKINTRRRGETQIILISPSGTRSELLSERPLDDHRGEWEFTFMTVHSWDENPEGTWQLEIQDKPKNLSQEHLPAGLSQLTSLLDASGEDESGYLRTWSLILYGTAGDRYSRAFSSKQTVKMAYHPSETTVELIKRGETENAKNVHVKRAGTLMQQKRTNEEIEKLAAQITDMLEKERKQTQQKRVLDKGHTHAKRVLDKEQPLSTAKKSSQMTEVQLSNSNRKENEYLITVLRSLEHLLENEKKGKH